MMVVDDIHGRRCCGKREEEEEPVSKLSLAWVRRMSGLTRDRRAEPVSREIKFSGANGDWRQIIFPVTSSRIGNHKYNRLCLLEVSSHDVRAT